MVTSAEANAKKRRILIIAVSIFIVVAVVVAMVPLLMNLFMGNGVKTEGIESKEVSAASTAIDGEWQVTNRPGSNSTSAGFTFDEVLPGERRTTSASTQGVTGFATSTLR